MAGAHAYQLRLQMPVDDSSSYSTGGPDPERAEMLRRAAAAHGRLASGDLAAREIIEAAGLEIGGDLPVSAAAQVLGARCPGAPIESLRAWANLVQVALEVERDGTALQDLFRLYLDLGLLATADELGLDDDNAVFLEMGAEMASAAAGSEFARECGFALDAAAFQIALRKVANWAVKHRGLIGPAEYADEISRRPDVAAALPAVRGMPPTKIQIIGHSFSMSAHWAAHASFTDTALELMRRENPRIERRWLGEGGMRATRAREAYFDDALAWSPDIVIFVVAMREPEHYAAMEEMARELAARGVRAVAFDRLHPDPGSFASPETAPLAELASRTGLEVVQVGRILDESPERDGFLSLDGIHCRGGYHRLMAAELVKYLAGARPAGLE